MRGLDRGPRRALATVVALMILSVAPAAGQIGTPLPPGAPEAPEAPEQRDARDCVCIEDLAGMVPARIAFSMDRRARLGVMLGEPAEVAGRPGVRLEDVPEGTPARRAGLREGDVIVALEGTALGDGGGSRLVELMAEVEPGDTVAVTFFRGDREQTARVVTEAHAGLRALAPGGEWVESLPHRELEALRALRAPLAEAARAAREAARVEGLRPAMLRFGRLADLELAAVNPELGQYFGTDRGVLVARVPDDSRLGLRAGDVILAIGGRDVQDPSHVRAILASYREGEEIVFRVVREQRTREVTGRHE